MMILPPEWITAQDVHHAEESVAEKNPGLDLGEIRVLDLVEGHSVQTPFIGPYLEEAPVIEELHRAYMPAHGLSPAGAITRSISVSHGEQHRPSCAPSWVNPSSSHFTLRDVDFFLT